MEVQVMSAEAITKEQYLEELAEKAAERIRNRLLLSGASPVSVLCSSLKNVIIEEMTPLLRLIG